MGKSKHSKLFNPTGLADWDEYYETVWLIWTPILLLFFLIVGVAIYNTYVRHLS